VECVVASVLLNIHHIEQCFIIKVTWVGHAAHMEEIVNAFRVLVRKPQE
jgi:hypothetical protein